MTGRQLTALLLAAMAASPAGAAGRGEGLLAETRTVLPGEAVTGAIMLFSDGPWRAEDTARLAALRARGAAVMGVDTAALLGRIERADEDCVYVMAAIEDLTKSLQRGLPGGAYRQPLLAGRGEGGALALALMAQTPPGTVEGALAVDPDAGLPLARALCTEAARVKRDGLVRYGLSPTPLPAPVEIAFTAGAGAEARAHAAELQAAHPDISIVDLSGPQGPGPTAGPQGPGAPPPPPMPGPAHFSDAPPAPPPPPVPDPGRRASDALTDQLAARLAANEAEPLGLPLTLLPVPPKHDTLAIIWSGDGGWRDIDKQIGSALAADGVPVVGIDALRYFWQERSPEDTAADLARIIAAYTAQWKVGKVALIGYSFGADILPATFNRLPPETQALVRQISLLGLSRTAAWEISVSGWLGQEGEGPETLPEITRIDPRLIQCFYGEEEPSPCPDLAGAELFRTKGGHHFDGNYGALADDILAGIDRRR